MSIAGTIDASLATSASVLGDEIPEAPRPGLAYGDSTLDWSDNPDFFSPRRRSITAGGACGACDGAYVPGVLSFRLRISFHRPKGCDDGGFAAIAAFAMRSVLSGRGSRGPRGGQEGR
jgi:hypothetical protein